MTTLIISHGSKPGVLLLCSLISFTFLSWWVCLVCLWEASGLRSAEAGQRPGAEANDSSCWEICSSCSRLFLLLPMCQLFAFLMEVAQPPCLSVSNLEGKWYSEPVNRKTKLFCETSDVSFLTYIHSSYATGLWTEMWFFSFFWLLPPPRRLGARTLHLPLVVLRCGRWCEDGVKVWRGFKLAHLLTAVQWRTLEQSPPLFWQNHKPSLPTRVWRTYLVFGSQCQRFWQFLILVDFCICCCIVLSENGLACLTVLTP